MRRWCHPTSRDLWVAANPAPSEPRGCCPRSHQSWAFTKMPTRCETSQATTQITSCEGLQDYLLPSNKMMSPASGAFRGLQAPLSAGTPNTSRRVLEGLARKLAAGRGQDPPWTDLAHSGGASRCTGGARTASRRPLS